MEGDGANGIVEEHSELDTPKKDVEGTPETVSAPARPEEDGENVNVPENAGFIFVITLRVLYIGTKAKFFFDLGRSRCRFSINT